MRERCGRPAHQQPGRLPDGGRARRNARASSARAARPRRSPRAAGTVAPLSDRPRRASRAPDGRTCDERRRARCRTRSSTRRARARAGLRITAARWRSGDPAIARPLGQSRRVPSHDAIPGIEQLAAGTTDARRRTRGPLGVPPEADCSRGHLSGVLVVEHRDSRPRRIRFRVRADEARDRRPPRRSSPRGIRETPRPLRSRRVVREPRWSTTTEVVATSAGERSARPPFSGGRRGADRRRRLHRRAELAMRTCRARRGQSDARWCGSHWSSESRKRDPRLAGAGQSRVARGTCADGCRRGGRPARRRYRATSAVSSRGAVIDHDDLGGRRRPLGAALATARPTVSRPVVRRDDHGDRERKLARTRRYRRSRFWLGARRRDA